MALGQRRGTRVRRQHGLDEQRIAQTIEVRERELQRLRGDGGAGSNDIEESVYGGATCAGLMSVPRERQGGLTGVTGDVDVEIKWMGIVDGPCESSSGLLCRELVGNFRIDRVDVHHAGDHQMHHCKSWHVRSLVSCEFPPDASPAHRALGTVGSAHASH